MKGNDSLNSEDILKHIIIYFGNNNEQRIGRELDQLKNKSTELNKSALNFSVKTDELQTIQRAMERYLNVDVVDSIGYKGMISRGSKYDQWSAIFTLLIHHPPQFLHYHFYSLIQQVLSELLFSSRYP